MAHSTLILKEPDALFATYKMRLKIARIDGIHTPSDVFNESYARIASMIRNGQPIKNLVALYHSVGRNVIHEYSRAHQRQKKIRDRVEKHKQIFQQERPTHSEEEALKDLKRKVLNCVNPYEAKIIFLYHSQGKTTWKDVCQALIDAGDIPEKEVSLTLINKIKKQYSRAIKRIEIK